MGDDVFEKDVRPVLREHCFSCHGPEKQKGKIRLDQLNPDMVQGDAAETWHDALNMINLGEMPPEDEPQLSTAARSTLTQWISKELKRAAKARRNTGGQVVMRRLNRAEYQYTMTDLLGFGMDYGDEFPSDTISPDGFRNNGASLEISARQIENYLKAARKAIDFVLVEGEQPERTETRIERNKGGMKGPGSKRFLGQSSDRLGRVNFWHGSFKNLPRTNPFTIRIKASTDRKPGQPVPILFARYGYFVSGLTLNIMGNAGEIEIPTSTPTYYEISGRPELFPLPETHVPAEKLNGVITLQNALIDGKPAPKPVSKVIKVERKGKIRNKKTQEFPEDPDFPRIIIESVEIAKHDYSLWPPSLHRGIVPATEDLSSDSSVRNVIGNFLRRAWRRPVDQEEIEQWTAHFAEIKKQGGSEIFALKEILAASLASSNFIYLIEPHLAKELRKLSSHELASRLSYFLWSSMPDDELFGLADSGRILESSVLKQQFARMLANEKADRFAKQFTMQWLDLEAVDRVAINPQYYKNFDNRIKPDMVGETLAFFKEILRSNTSALQFLDADFTMLNATLAKHYGLSGPQSQRFERVVLKGTDRPGGLLGHASTHLAGSDGADSHPIKRAVWIRERLLHDPPNPPPPDVPALEKSVPHFEKLSIREQLSVHRQKAACADCHRGIDPWGIPLEGFDAVGLSREKTARGGKPVSTDAVLPGNHPVSGLSDLQDYLLKERRQQFTHAFVTKLFIYALGRTVELRDQPLIEELSEAFAKDGYRIPALMANIVTSEPFLSR